MATAGSDSTDHAAHKRSQVCGEMGSPDDKDSSASSGPGLVLEQPWPPYETAASKIAVGYAHAAHLAYVF